MLKEVLDIIKNWISGQKPVPIPIPVDSGSRRSGSAKSSHPGTYRFMQWLPIAMLLVFLFRVDVAAQSGTILFLGDSLTAGYGIDENQAYPALIQERLDEMQKDWTVINAGLSGETSSGGLRRINWLLRTEIDVLVLALGANDGLRGVDLSLTESNLQSIIDRVREKNPDVRVVLAGMQVPPNLGTSYTEQFRTMFPRLAQKNDAVLIPFLLEDVAGIPELNLPDGIHPTPKGHEIMAETVWTYLSQVL